MTSDPSPVIEQFEKMLSALVERTSPPSLMDPTPHLDDPGDLRRYPAAFLVTLCGPAQPRYGDALDLLNRDDGDVGGFFAAAVGHVRRELRIAAENHSELLDALVAAAQVGSVEGEADAFDLVWNVLFPEGAGLAADWAGGVTCLRHRRGVEITDLNPNPIVDPVQEVLFTSNVLLSPGGSIAWPDHWYDHPIPLGSDPKDSELAHGLRKLDGAIGFELARNSGWCGPATLALSVSSTHDAFEDRGRELVQKVVDEVGPLPNLRLLVFDEVKARQLWDRVIAPATAPSDTAPSDTETSTSPPVLGVSGAYGRHFSFLKAVAALWSVCIDSRVVATFKLDLDQSFPQSRLLAETGQTALEHLTTPRWGARGVASTGETVDLMMIAGGLVNQADVDRSVFTPDVDRVPPGSSAEHAIFFSRLPRVLSTEAEIVSRYGAGTHDGIELAQERVHVTGGTTGVLVEGLRRWRLFTPSVFGRAEDQAYLVSGLAGQSRPAYVHEPGLIMSHDKAELIPEVLQHGAASKHIGDLIRTRLFSKYVTAKQKHMLDPFTGCFVSRVPLTVTTLRFAVHALDPDLTRAGGEQYLLEGVRRLREAEEDVANLDNLVSRERKEWATFYDALDAIEGGLSRGERWAATTRATAQQIVGQAEIRSRPGAA